MAEDNPFLALFEVTPPKKNVAPTLSKPSQSDNNSKHAQQLNEAIEDIFGFTLNPYGLLGRPDNDPVKQSGLVILESVALELQHEQNGRTWLGLDVLSQALFERLLMTSEDLNKSLVIQDKVLSQSQNHSTQNLVIVYLAQAYFRARNLQKALKEGDDVKEAIEQIKDLVVQNTCTAFTESELYAGQDLLSQTIQVFEAYDIHQTSIIQWFEAVLNKMVMEGSEIKAKQLVFDILTTFKKDIIEAPFMVLSDGQVSKLQYFIKTPTIARFFMDFNLARNSTGMSYHETLIGAILSKSCLPLTEMHSYDFFQDPSKQPGSVHASTESRIWTGLEIIHEMVYEVFNTLFRVDSGML